MVVTRSHTKETPSSAALDLDERAVGHVEDPQPTTMATGTTPTATGTTPTATGYESGATGTTPTATGYESGATGTTPTATGYGSGATGTTPTATGYESGATGTTKIATSTTPTATGTTTIASGTTPTTKDATDATSTTADNSGTTDDFTSEEILEKGTSRSANKSGTKQAPTRSTLKPNSITSSKRSARRKLMEVEAEEKLAALKLKQVQAEIELEQARLRRRQAENESSSEEEIEDNLASVRINNWLNEKDTSHPVPPPVVAAFLEERRKKDMPVEENTMKTAETRTEKQKEDQRVIPSVQQRTIAPAEKNQEDHQVIQSVQEHLATQAEKHQEDRPVIQPVQQQFDVSTLAEAFAQATKNTSREPPRYIQDLPIFGGHSSEWLTYKYAFVETQHYFANAENIVRLRRSLRGPALEAVSSRLIGQPDPMKIIDALERRFGRPEALIQAEIEKLKTLNKLTENPRDLCIFAGKIANVVGTIEALKKPQYLHSPETIKYIVEKLTPIMKSKWYDYAALKNEGEPELLRISRFLDEEADKCGPYAVPENIVEDTRERAKKKTERTFTASVTKQRDDYQCPICKQDHKLPDCKQFLSSDVNTRWDVTKKNFICFRCLKSKHRRMYCKARPCGQDGCRLKHHRLLHHKPEAKKPEDTPTPVHQKASIASTIEVAASANEHIGRRAFLKIAPVILRGPHTSIDTYALLDEGSTITIIDASIAEVLGVDGPANTMWIQGVGTEVKHEESKAVSLKIRGKHAKKEFNLEEVRTIQRLKFASQDIDEDDLETCSHLEGIKHELIYERATPKILIGQDNWNLIVSREIRSGRRNQPVASLTELGWVLHGCSSSLTNTVAFCGHLTTKKEEQMKNFFKLESLGIEPRKPKDDPEERALRILESKSHRLPGGRYETGLLWKDDNMQIPNNYKDAEKRLISLEKRLDKDETLKIQYTERMNNLFTSGYAEKATTPPVEDRTWYLPHFPVVNPAKPHKPPRLVHDAAAKYRGISLNDLLLPGPDLLQSLPGVVMKFRQYPVAVSADIKEMFMQIKIRKEDRDALRFLWRGEQREGPPEEFQMTSVIFGASSSPCTALYIKNRNADDHASEYPEAAVAIKKNHYMDDYLQSFESVEEARKEEEVDAVHRKAGFILNGWASSNKEVIEDCEGVNKGTTSVNIGASETEKALGLQWYISEDCFGFRINRRKTPPEILENIRSPTKREALSVVMSLFDPLGLISPVTTPAKRILQDTWRYKSDWDEDLPEELQPKWGDWITSLRAVEDIRIPRCYDYKPAAERQLHTFVDASEEAYAAAVYWRTTRSDGSVHVSLAAAKSRVTPLKPISIPRLELQAALLGARLARTVLLEHDFEVTSKTYWSDSRTALAWIRAEPKSFKTFVAHRLAEIEDTTKKNEWRWLPTRENVADDATRATPHSFDFSHRWFNGPDFLYLPEEKWPKEQKSTEVIETGEEKEKCNVAQDRREHNHLPDINKFSRWLRLIRTTARVLQFIDLCRPWKSSVAAAKRKRTIKNKEEDSDWRQNQKFVKTRRPGKIIEKKSSFRTVPADYIKAAEEHWIRASQEESFGPEMKRVRSEATPHGSDRLSTLSVYIDEKGTLRLKGRVTSAHQISENASNPPLMDGKHPYTRLYIQYVHEKLHHGGVEIVINELRQRMWILRIRPTVKEIIKRCISCQLRRKKPTSPSTGDLPAARLAHHARPFTYTGLDYFGPIEVTVGRHREKRYGALFTCMTCRAIHIEVVYSLSADSAIAALRRFMARRGCPTELWSDNATCFKAAERELSEAAIEALQEEAANRQITWRYIPPGAPFMGGAWERMVRAVKEALRVTLQDKYPSDEVLLTLLTEAENTVNSRPLTHVGSEPEDPEGITPNLILIGPNNRLPTFTRYEDKDITPKQQWKRAQMLADIFWQRWVREYIPLLQHRREPRTIGVPPKEGDLVIICDSNLPRNTWPRGRISKVYPGKDGETRVVDVITKGGHVLRRPTKKIVVIQG